MLRPRTTNWSRSQPADYTMVAEAFANGGTVPSAPRAGLIQGLPAHGQYDTAIAAYPTDRVMDGDEPQRQVRRTCRPKCTSNWFEVQLNRYGENPHRRGGLYGYARRETRLPRCCTARDELQQLVRPGWRGRRRRTLRRRPWPSSSNGNPCSLANAPSCWPIPIPRPLPRIVSAFGRHRPSTGRWTCHSPAGGRSLPGSHRRRPATTPRRLPVPAQEEPAHPAAHRADAAPLSLHRHCRRARAGCRRSQADMDPAPGGS